MKIILIIQSLIILVCAYYIYTLNQVVEAPTIVKEEVLPTLGATSTVPEAEVDVPEELTAPGPAAVSGPNDAGMEWPVLEGELEVR